MILPPIQEHRGSPKQRKLRMYNNCAHAIDICFIFVILGLFSVFLLHIVLHKTFFFGECKREVIEVLVCCSTLSLFRFLLSVGERRSKYLHLILQQPNLFCMIAHIYSLTLKQTQLMDVFRYSRWTTQTSVTLLDINISLIKVLKLHKGKRKSTQDNTTLQI